MYTEEDTSDDSDDGSTLRRMSPNTRQDFRKKVTVVVCLSSAITVLILNIIGALLFLVVENSSQSEIIDFSDFPCFSHLTPGTEITVKTRRNLENCMEKSSKIDNFGKAFYFSWTLYTTVGYGNLFPHTGFGRFSAVTYSLFVIPVYIAFKFEFGTLLAELLLKIANRIMKSMKRGIIPTTTSTDTVFRDRLIVGLSIVMCSASVLLSSVLFSTAESIGFWPSVYFGVVTTALIGLGDVVPDSLPWFLGYAAFFLISDVLSNHIFYFCQFRIRRCFHWMARRLLLVEQEQVTMSVSHVPVINSRCMPNHVMDCEKEEADKDEMLLNVPTVIHE